MEEGGLRYVLLAAMGCWVVWCLVYITNSQDFVGADCYDAGVSADVVWRGEMSV